MSATTKRWAEEVKDSVDAVKTLRDELKVQIHLANMDAKQKFEELERKFDNDQLNVRKTMHTLAENFRGLKDELARTTRPTPKA